MTISEIIKEDSFDRSLRLLNACFGQDSCSPGIYCKNGCEEEKNLRTAAIIKLWKERQEEAIQERLSQETEKIFEEDPFYKEVKDAVERVDSLITAKGYPALNIDCHNYSTDVSDGALHKLDIDVSAREDSLEAEYKEICAMLKACETYEQEMAVLAAYGIVAQDINEIYRPVMINKTCIYK